ncbi:MAG TPA: glycosyltransferase family 2 protein [candidate division Zixibacteria bacterium]|nr:glycosyltransferase family 2 protein [candidate division Zixibacteria bacterium]
MKSLPKISIITPSLNQGRFLEQTIRSVLDQQYSNLEYIIIDGGSTDETLAVLRRYEKHLIWVSEPDNGQTDAINKGFLRAHGDIVAWLCADDLYEKDTIRRVVEYFQHHTATGMVYGECLYIDAQGKVIGKYPTTNFDIESLLSFCFIPQPTVFLRRSVLDRVGILDPALQFAMDLDLWIRVALKEQIDFLPKVLARYRLHNGSKTVSWSTAVEKEGIRVRERYLKDPALNKRIGRAHRKVSNTVFLRAASFYFYEGDLTKTVEYLMKAFRANPVSREIWRLPLYAWRSMCRRRERRLRNHSAEERIVHLVGARPQ